MMKVFHGKNIYFRIENTKYQKNNVKFRHPEAETAQQLVRQQLNGFGLQTVLKLLQPGGSKFPLRKVSLKK